MDNGIFIESFFILKKVSYKQDKQKFKFANGSRDLNFYNKS